VNANQQKQIFVKIEFVSIREHRTPPTQRWGDPQNNYSMIADVRKYDAASS